MQNYRPADAVVADVIQRTWTAISESKVASSLQELHFYVINPAVASPALRRSRYFTDSLQALRDEMTIVVNEEFLTEVEIAVRSFALSQSLTGTQYLRSDEQFLGLVKRVEADRRKVLERLRRHPQDAGVGLEPEESIRQELAMVTLFFVSHELGHLLGGHPEGEFSSFVDPRAPLEDRIDAAVVKLCRHVDEFSRHKFGLPGFRRTEQERAACAVWQSAMKHWTLPDTSERRSSFRMKLRQTSGQTGSCGSTWNRADERTKWKANVVYTC